MAAQAMGYFGLGITDDLDVDPIPMPTTARGAMSRKEMSSPPPRSRRDGLGVSSETRGRRPMGAEHT